MWQEVGNYARAGKTVIDEIIKRDDVDADKIAVFGTSMGSRYSVEIGAYDDRVKAVVGQMANVGPTDVIFNQAQPNFKRIYMYMTDIQDEDEWVMVVAGAARLQIEGEADERRLGAGD